MQSKLLLCLLLCHHAISSATRIDSTHCVTSFFTPKHTHESAISPGLVAIGTRIAMLLEKWLPLVKHSPSEQLLLEVAHSMCPATASHLASTQQQAPSMCLAARFAAPSQSSLTMSVSSPLSEEQCKASACAGNTVYLGYVWSPGKCQYITNIPTVPTATTWFCVQRGGCTGKANSDCVWRTISSSNIGNTFPTVSASSNVTNPISSLTDCEVACDITSTCSGFVYDFQALTCQLFGTGDVNAATAVIGVTLPGLSFTSSPTSCWLNQSCGPFVVSVPPMYGTPKVLLQSASGPTNPVGAILLRTVNQVATFSNVNFTAVGTYSLTAAADGVVCSGTSLSVTVADENAITLFRFVDSDFPTSKGFWLFRLKDNCEFVALVIAGIGGAILFLMLNSIGLLITFSLQQLIVNAVMVCLLVLIGMKDSVQAWTYWQCSTQAQSSLAAPFTSSVGSLASNVNITSIVG